MGMLKNISYYSIGESCSMQAHSCSPVQDQVSREHTCCLDQTLSAPGILVVKKEEKSQNLFPPFSLSFFQSFNLIDGLNLMLNDIKHQKFSPPEIPLPQKEILIEIQRFLI
mgnify:CR=1 FL=1|tara:strand:- start:228 stop:560 length:333 start_codon:yes stop_codon:yes gene_type:complete